MKFSTQKLFLLLVFISATRVNAQVNWPTPEVGQMYRNAHAYMDAGNLNDAIITYKQAITLAPGIMILYRDLGEALYRSGNYDEAEKVLDPLIKNAEADVNCFQLLAATQEAKKDAKHALKTIDKGLEKFPSSGMLCHEAGNAHSLEKDEKAALNSWLDGIQKDASFAKNYYDAANIYLNSDDVLWGLLYGEMFLAIPHDTTTDNEMKNNLFKGYKILFDNFGNGDVPKYGDVVKQATVNTFEDAVLQVYRSLMPVMSDGITTENLTMLRVRFLMEWGSVYSKKYPFSLFSYQDKITRSGHFDMYNEWLFGEAESATEYKAWNEFHEGDMMRFLQWKSENKFVPVANEFYNDRGTEGIFGKKKK